ncbi:MAG: acetylglutamate kinase [Planctomycetaceae bacterium]|nr:acetylglutamate kinase [Planctomycetaceae bacterium]
MICFPRREEYVDEAVRKADVLVEALGWIRQFRDRYVVIKLGGSALEDPESVRACLTDVIFMETVGMRPILVHGGGKSISRAMQTAGIEPRFVEGRRYTDDATLDIVSRVLAEDICESLVDEIQTQGGRAVGLNFRTQNVLIGERLTLDGENGEPVDLGRVGHVVDIQRDVLAAACRTDTVPVIPSIAVDREGGLLNVNADTAAAAIARLLNAEKLVFLSDVAGIFLDREDESTLQRHLTARRCRELIADGTIDTGMIPKVEAGIEALEAGVRKVHMVDARFPHSLLLEIYSDEGIGTEIIKLRPSAIN